MCGGTPYRPRRNLGPDGSSNLGRIWDTLRRGLSPRVRGNRRDFELHYVTRYRVYPRVCGGTSEKLDLGAVIPTGSIPACAGEPLKGEVVFVSPLNRVYPRVCGGTVKRIASESGGWSIPACAGEPDLLKCDFRIWRENRVYPRVCGGTPCLHTIVDFGNWGSIPACAGEPHSNGFKSRATVKLGSIPACAGEPYSP